MDIWRSAFQVYRQWGEKTNFGEVERLAAQVAGRYQSIDPCESAIAEYLHGYHGDITIGSLARDALKIESARLDQLVQKRIGDILRGLGYERRYTRIGNSRRAYTWLPAFAA